MASFLTTRGMHAILAGTVNLTTDTVKAMLLNSAFTPLVTHNFVADISASELSGTGYTAGFGGGGRLALTGKTLTEDDGTRTATFDAADLQWPAITAGTAAWAAIILEATSDADSLVLGYIGFPPVVTSGSALDLVWHPIGIFRITYWGGANTTVHTVDYTVTGSEGADFMVTIGTTMADDLYTVLWAPKGVVNIPLLDLPDTIPGDRTTTAFRVLIGGHTAGDVLTFVVFE